jgi:small-conductance mechanosensitive channel
MLFEAIHSEPARQALLWGLFLLSLGVLFLAHRRLFRFLKTRAEQSPSALDDAIVQMLSTPSLFIFLWIAVSGFGHIQLADHPLSAWFDKLNTLLLIFFVAWLAIKAVKAAACFVQKSIDLKTPDNLRARKTLTQLLVFQAIADTLIVIVALIAGLLTFDAARTIGLSLLTSAGIIGVIVGFAAQKSLGMVLAGLQIALTQPIRIDDVVVVEGEWGRIEEINLTYVVVKIWDERRLVLPVTYFLEKPFQNWTRTSASVLGSVFLFLDYAVPVDPLRAELKRLVADDPPGTAASPTFKSPIPPNATSSCACSSAAPTRPRTGTCASPFGRN